MKSIKFFFIPLLILFAGCKTRENNSEIPDSYDRVVTDTIRALTPFQNYFVVGNFTGNKKQDTISVHYFSGLQNVEVFNKPVGDWDVVVDWFAQQKAHMYLKINNPLIDTLNAGFACGVYYLKNIGDINGDGKDEIGFTANFLDYSQINSFNIYSFCNDKWTSLKNFTILESSFDNLENEVFDSTQIKDFFEFKEGNWYYTDYNGEEKGKKMTLLKVDNCN